MTPYVTTYRLRNARQLSIASRAARRLLLRTQEVSVEKTELIRWSHDFDAAAAESKRAAKPLLVDFSAAPM